MKKIIGVTGKVGVGKTYLVNKLIEHNPKYELIDLDVLGHEVLEKNDVKRTLREIFGDSIFEENKISRDKLARKVFTNVRLLKELNKVSHPIIKYLAKNKIKNSEHNIILIVGALIKEIGLIQNCNDVITIVADERKRNEYIGHKKHIENVQETDDAYKQVASHVFYNEFIKDGVEKFSILVQNLVSK